MQIFNAQAICATADRAAVNGVVSRAIARAMMRQAVTSGAIAPVRTGASKAAFPAWEPLLDACSHYCQLSGWRFLTFDFDLSRAAPSAAALDSRVRALPTVLEYAEYCRGASERGALLIEFGHCQR